MYLSKKFLEGLFTFNMVKERDLKFIEFQSRVSDLQGLYDSLPKI